MMLELSSVHVMNEFERKNDAPRGTVVSTR